MTLETQRLVLLHTNDLHSHFEQMPQIAAYIKQMRNKVGHDHLLTLEIGDHMDRMRPETDGTGGIANVEVMNATGYDAAVLGNNEGLTFTPESLRTCYLNRAEFPVIGSNIRDIRTGSIPDWMEPYKIVRKGSLNIGLIGVTAAFQTFYKELGWDVTDPLVSIAHWVRELRPQVDLLIVMSHLGIREDERMATEINGIDIVLGGHTHHVLLKPQVVGSTHLCAAGKFGQYIGEVVIDYESDHHSRQIKSITGCLIETNQLPLDNEVAQIIADNTVRAANELSHEIAFLDHSLAINWYEESELGNLLASGLKRWTSAEIGLVNAGQILQGLPQGKVIRGQLLEICPGPINPCLYLLRGKDLLEALEQALIPEFTHKQIRGFGFRGEVLGTLCIDGLNVEYDMSRLPMDRIVKVLVNNDLLELEREYSIGTIDMFTFGVGYMSLSKGFCTKFLLPEFLRDILSDQLQSKEEIIKAQKPRWISSIR